MPDGPTYNRTRTPAAAPAAPAAGDEDEFRSSFDEDLIEALDVTHWHLGRDLGEEYSLIEAEVRKAVERETEIQRTVREQLFGMLPEIEGAPPHAGKHVALLEDLKDIQRTLLFPGGVECCDGYSEPYDTLALTLYQIGVSLVSYSGDQGSWRHRLFRRDLHQRHGDPVAETLALLESRNCRGGLREEEDDALSELATRGIMTFAERAVLVRQATAPWRMGQGSPAPIELICSSYPDLVLESIRVLRELIEYRKFVFVSSTPRTRDFLTIGQALYPLEYAIVTTLRDHIARPLERWHCYRMPRVDNCWDGVPLTPEQWVCRFRDEIAPQVLVGVFRASPLAPPQLFYAHQDEVHLAAHIVLADSMFQVQRGFPQLIDLADGACKVIYGGASLAELAQNAFLAAGAPFRYGSERETRR